MSFSNPFSLSSSRPGNGNILVSLLPPSTPVLQTLSYQYPLKLIAPNPITANDRLVYTVFILTYGGGLVAGDTILLDVTLAPLTRLTLLTQGSTKIYNTPDRKKLTQQYTVASIADGSALCYLPDPVQPFARSAFSQTQVYNLQSRTNSSICVCDWVCEGRPARNETWSFYSYTSKNEVWLTGSGELEAPQKKRLLIRDNLIMDDNGSFSTGLRERVDGQGIFGTLIIHGSMFEQLGNHFMNEFEHLPRMGNRKWDDHVEQVVTDPIQAARLSRQGREKTDGLLWTSAKVRGSVLVKFGAKEVEGARRWLYAMFKAEGTVEREFGERALLCLR
ncbi:urease accessory protein-like protein UreD [Pseudovirgaria hyperparasitica]|uniref:Urease accessory protein-like protein UreD n=1 Tax=Pseudovirgaria hyperparasitica TaxID=470096 RepID=A0A6A6WKR0_9PEZI|nr:urease accessory protein-like protein UreD [Pseudovirgaria hyperparasitica]KAF2762756.1 urease accessory protein-like protein UreD [Pseudovirgaria hyperparasitica]